jgi:hypothetical protein
MVGGSSGREMERERRERGLLYLKKVIRQGKEETRRLSAADCDSTESTLPAYTLKRNKLITQIV